MHAERWRCFVAVPIGDAMQAWYGWVIVLVGPCADLLGMNRRFAAAILWGCFAWYATSLAAQVSALDIIAGAGAPFAAIFAFATWSLLGRGAIVAQPNCVQLVDQLDCE